MTSDQNRVISLCEEGDQAAAAVGEDRSSYLVRAALDRATSEGADLDQRARSWLRRELRRRLNGLI